MAGTTVVTCKAAVIDALAASSTLIEQDVQVEFQYPGGTVAGRELIYGGGVTGSQEPAAMRGGGRVPRLEEAEVTLTVEVHDPGGTPREVELRAEAIATTVVELLAGDPQLQQQSGLLFAGATTVQLEPAELLEEGATASLAITLNLRSFLK